MNNLVNTIDYASVDDQKSTPDFHALYAAGFRVVILRRSYAFHDKAHNAFRLAHDYVYERDAQQARDAGLVVGAYMFPCFDKGASSPKEQVANFCAAGGTIEKGIDLPPWLDVEFSGNGSADTGRTHAELAALVDEYLTEINDQLNVVAGIYSSNVQMTNSNGLGDVMKFDKLLPDHPLWQKIPYRLGAGNALDQVAPRMPHEGRDPTDPNNYWRTPLPWEKTSGAALVQTQGDVRGLPGNLHQADVGVFPILKLGASSSHVMWIKRRLETFLAVAGRTGTPTLLSIDSPVFDSELDRVVRDFQTSKSLVVDGVIGPKTWAAIAWLS